MAVAKQLLLDILKEITEAFEQHPSITVTPIKGDPPEQYEVKYGIKGVYQEEDGRILPSTSHIVTIAIPFGYPHFPPSCRPSTPIFHPDFDPSSICLGDFWQQDHSVAELITHIGRMIAGEIYSRDNAFNEEAAAWYLANTDKLPFARSDTLDEVGIQQKTSVSASLAGTIGIDTLDDSDFASDMNFLELEGNAKAVPPSGPRSKASAQVPEFDVETIWLLSRQKRFHQMQEIFKSMPTDVTFEGKDELLERIETVFAEAHQIYQQGEDLEHQGLPAKALEKYIAVEEMMSDYPKIHEDIRRTEQSKDLLGEWVKDKAGSGADGLRAREKRRPGKTGDKSPPAGGSSNGARRPASQTVRNRRQINFLPLAIIGGLLLVTAPLIYVYTSETNRHEQAEQLYDTCTAQIQARHFKIAARSCESALSLTQGIIFVKKQAGAELSGKIETLLNSEELRQGLAGNVLVNDAYVPQAIADSLKSSQNILADGDKLMSEGNWKKAIEAYNSGLQAIGQDAKLDPSFLVELRRKIHLGQVNLLIQEGDQAIAGKNWQLAQKKFEGALVEAKHLTSEEQRLFTAGIQARIDKCTFLLLKQQGDEMFANSDWTGAFTMFQQAISLGSRLKQSESKTLGSLQGDVIRAELYTVINEGKEAFAAEQWDEAIKKYAKASKILMDNRDLLNRTDTDMNRQKLARIMLQTSIIRDRQEADERIAEKKYSEAETSLQRVVKAINTSSLGNEQEFQVTLDTVRKTIADIRDKQYIAEKSSYLEVNFQALFSQNYPAAAPETLSMPVITYIKQTGDQLLFKMQCAESGRGRPLQLVMYYTYSKGSNQWAFHSTIE
jgi:ubiquitin-protein ligase